MMLEEKQQEALQGAMSGENIFISGEAGTGKSHITKEIIKKLEYYGRNVVVLAPTGIAAINVGGGTIHGFFGISPNGIQTANRAKIGLPNAVRIWKKTQTIIIDEISMVRADILDFIKWTLEKNDIYLKSIQWIIVGDTKQLEAVLTNEDKPFFPYEKNCFKESKFFNELKFKEIELDVVKRQSDNEFIRNLNILRNTGRLSPYFNQFKNKKLEGTIITSTRKQKDSINEFFLNKIEEKEIILKGEISNEQNFKENHFPVKKEIIVKNGCKVKYLRNEKDGRVNGTEGTFVEKDKSYLFVDEAGEEYPLYKSTFERHEYKIVEGKPKLVIVCSIDQYPIAVKYGATVHGSQGLTHEKVVVNLHGMFAKNQLYVAISRCKSPDGLCIINTSNVINFFQQFFDNNKKKENDF